MAPEDAEMLPSWRDGATKRAILEFLAAVTTEGSPDYAAPNARLAAFDNDGTLWPEQPIYTEVAFAADRLKNLAPLRSEWAGHAPFQAALAGDMTALAQGGFQAMAQIVITAQAGTTVDAFQQLVRDWLTTARHPRFRRIYTECVYQPMLEVLTLFRSCGFRTCIVSGGTAEFMRPWTEKVYGVPAHQVVGSFLKLHYQLQDGRGELLQLDQIDAVNEGEGKPAGISRLLGGRPLAAFGNSDSDYDMLQYTTTGPGRRLGVLVHHDDPEREYAYDRGSPVGQLDLALTDATRNGWLVPSMKQDWVHVLRGP